jgi:hypothetical protein
MVDNVKYNEYLDEDLNRDVLKGDNDFIVDAMSFLEKRTGRTDFENEEDVYDAYMEHMRFHDTNEVTAVRDLMYAQEATDEDKMEFGRLLDVYDRMEGDPLSWKMAGDYLEAGITSPSTWLGLVSGGAGKAGGLAAKEAAKVGIRTIIGETLKSMGKGAVVEGAIGLGTGAAQEVTRVETGVQEEFTGGRTLATGIGQAIAGTLPAGVAGIQQTIATKGAKEIAEKGAVASAKATQAAKENTQKVLAGVEDKAKIVKTQDELLSDNIKKAREFLKEQEAVTTTKQPLDETKVREGLELLRGLSGTEKTIAMLDDDVIESITAASIKLGDEVEVKPGERITSAVSRALEDGRITTDRMDEVLKEFDLTSDQFSYMYMAQLSQAGRTLAEASKIARSRGMTTTQKAEAEKALKQSQTQLDRLATAVTDYMNQSGTGMTKREAMDIANQAGETSRVRGTMQDLDRFRLSMMTGQLATTVRNVAGGSFRIATDVLDKSFKNLLNIGKEYDDPLAIARYALFNQAEAKVVRQLFEKNMPVEAERFFATFFESTVTPAKLGAVGGKPKGIMGRTFDRLAGGAMEDQSVLVKTGAAINVLNRMSDNMYKQAIFAGRLDQLARKQMGKPLADVIAEGKFRDISKDMIKDAVEESLDFVYQKTPTGKDVFSEFGRTILDAHRNLPFVVSTFIPFPRFVINQLSFVTEHMPLIGIATAKMQGKQAFSKDLMAKRATGGAMLSIAYAMRAQNGPETEWYEYKTDKGETIDLRPIAGPFNAFLLGADLIYRKMNGEEIKSYGGQAKDAFQALGGPQFRAGTGLYTLDRIVEDMSGPGEFGMKSQETVGRLVGDLINTFTLPAATLRDFGSLGSEEDRLVPETAYTNFFDIVAARATRSLPEIPGFSLSETVSEQFGTGEVKLDTPRADIFTGEPLRNIDPFERQLFGMGKRAEKNDFMKTLTRLQMSTYDIYKPADFPYEDRLMREMGGKTLAREMNEYVKSDEFKKLTPANQKLAIRERAKTVLADINAGVKQRMETPEYAQYRYERLPAPVRAAVKEQYQTQFPEDKEFDYLKALDLVPGVTQRARGYAVGGDVTAEDDQTNPFAISDDDFIFNAEAQADLEKAGEMAIEMGVGMLPIVGDVQDARDVYKALESEDYVDAALSSLGFIPIVGNFLKTGGKATRELISKADDLVQKRSLGAFVDKERRMPDMSNQEDLDELANMAAKQEKILAGASAGKGDILFHGSMEGGIDPSFNKKHKELDFERSLSASRDPLYATEVFGGGDLENVEVLIPKKGSINEQNLSPTMYDELGRMMRGEEINMPVGAVASDMPIKLPKSWHVEAETVVRDIAGDMEVSKLKDNPELFAKVKKGMEELNGKTLPDGTYVPGVNDNLSSAYFKGIEAVDLASGMDAYKDLATGLRGALGLGKYTSGAGARGTYDKIIRDIATKPEGDADDILDSLEVMRDSLVDNAGNLTQKGENVDTLIEIISDYRDIGPSLTAADAATEFRALKEAFMDVTNKMNRGGLASKR